MRSRVVVAAASVGMLAVVSSAWAQVQAAAQAKDVGQKTFETRCGVCHGGDGGGGEMGPPLAQRLRRLDDPQLIKVIHDGIPNKGMPPNPVKGPELDGLVKFLRVIALRVSDTPIVRKAVQMSSGATLEGQVLGEGVEDIQLRTDDKKVHLLRRAGGRGERFRSVTSDTPWPTYNGDPGGNRYTTLTQIDKQTIGRLAPAWFFTIPDTGTLQMTPVVVDGIMYVTAPNECYALDAGSGRAIWHYKRPRTKGVQGGNANRGVAVAGDRVFLETDNAHIIALDRFSGELLWDTELADWRQNYGASSAPLVAGDLVISGVSGGEHGANGFVAAHDQATGKEVWRFWTVPKPGEPGSETWKGKDILHGGAPTWFTGSYDAELDLVYWPTGNPAKEYDGRDRSGDNLYASCILALDRKTGALKWHYQFTPHDLWDWDATQTSVLVDAEWEGAPRKLMLHASRNGFFYVFDRRDGKLLLWKPFVKNLTWASGIDANGRPIRNPDQVPTAAGTKVCPSQDGATNWFSPSFNPATGLYYVQTFEKCSIYTRSDDKALWQAGRTYLGGTQKVAPDPIPQRVLKAIDIKTGAIKWEIPQPGPAHSWGGTISTATGLVIFGDESGALRAADAETGETLWSFPTNQNWRASPMTYAFDGRQFIGVASGSTVIAFALPRDAAAASSSK
jgi:alcohol dehydrogenase (cytochrome c)